MRISYWSSDVCSSDLVDALHLERRELRVLVQHQGPEGVADPGEILRGIGLQPRLRRLAEARGERQQAAGLGAVGVPRTLGLLRTQCQRDRLAGHLDSPPVPPGVPTRAKISQGSGGERRCKVVYNY